MLTCFLLYLFLLQKIAILNMAGVHSDVKCVSLPNRDTLYTLNEYNKFLESILENKLKSLTTIGGYTSYLCSNSLDEIQFTDEICLYINSIIVKFSCFGIYSGIVISSMLYRMWSEPLCKFHVHLLSENLQQFKSLLGSSIDTLKYRDSQSDFSCLLVCLENMLSQEPTLCLSKNAFKEFSMSIVKTVICGMDGEDGFKLGRIHIHVEESSEHFFMASGLLVEVDHNNYNLLEDNPTQFQAPATLLLLTENFENPENLSGVLNSIENNNVKVIVCQKKINDLLKMLFRRRQILTIERVGDDIAKSVKQLSGALAIGDISMLTTQDFSKSVGSLSGVQALTVANSDKLLIVLEREGSHVSTLYVSCRTFNSVGHMKKSCRQSINHVYLMLTSRLFLPGPVYFEESLCDILKSNSLGGAIMDSIVDGFCCILNDICCIFKETGKSQVPNGHGDSYNLKKNTIMNAVDAVINALNISCIIIKQS